MKTNCNYINALFSWIMICFLFQNCSVKPSNSSSLAKQLVTHQRIEVEYDNNGQLKKKKVPNSKIDSLDATELSQVNQFLFDQNSSFPKSKDYVFISYYPGKDGCNSTGMATRNSIGKSNNRFEKELKKRENITSIYIMKNDEGITRWNKGVDYIMDSNQTIEQTFFIYHYPCSSYTILHKSGKYYSFFGPSNPEYQLLEIDLFMELIQRQPSLQN